MYIPEDTIAGLATAAGEGGIAIIRVSGPGAAEALERLTALRPPFTDHLLCHTHAVDPDGERIDECMAVYMKAPRTYTREDVAEFHLHGGRWASGRMLDALNRIGIRTAEPGEFTKRAFINGRIDLSQAEAVMGLIRSESDRAARCALRQLEGGVSAFVREAQEEITAALAGIEAALDYPEEITEAEACADLKDRVKGIRDRLRNAGSEKRARILENGLETVLCGSVNAGKSSLLNALCGETKAIVTDIPGTTRDIVSGTFYLDGIRINLKDTAGLRDSSETIEQIGIDLAKKAVRDCDLCLIVIDAARPVDPETEALLSETRDRDRIIVLNKQDLAPCPETVSRFREEAAEVSCSSLEGMDRLKERISAFTRAAGAGELSQLRHIMLAEQAADALDRALTLLEEGSGIDLAGIDLRDALDRLAAITGDRVDEALMESIFSRFCVGK